MVNTYNFLASWQLFPEKGSYEQGERPKSGIYKMETTGNKNELSIIHNWVTIENLAFTSQYKLIADGSLQDFENPEWADRAQVIIPDGINLEINFYKKGEAMLHVIHEILPNGYLKITQQGMAGDRSYTNTEIYHKQLSVLPYASSVAGAVIKPNEEGVMRHKALTAMEEQTNMQLTQIRKQIELLALQAQEIQQRKELSLMIYNARISFKPNIGQTYYLYEKADNDYVLSLIAPHEWGLHGPFSKFVAPVRLLADHTWMEL